MPRRGTSETYRGQTEVCGFRRRAARQAPFFLTGVFPCRPRWPSFLRRARPLSARSEPDWAAELCSLDRGDSLRPRLTQRACSPRPYERLNCRAAARWRLSTVRSVGPSHAPPGPAQRATNRGLLCSSYQVVPSRSQAMGDLGLYQNPSREAPETTWILASDHSRALSD